MQIGGEKKRLEIIWPGKWLFHSISSSPGDKFRKQIYLLISHVIELLANKVRTKWVPTFSSQRANKLGKKRIFGASPKINFILVYLQGIFTLTFWYKIHKFKRNLKGKMLCSSPNVKATEKIISITTCS